MYKSLSGFKKNAQLPCLIETFTKGEIFHERGLTESELSRTMVKDLKKRGMKYLGPITMYSYHYVLLSADSRGHKLPRRGLLFVLIKKEIKKDDFCIFYMVYFTMFYASLAVYGFSQIPKIL